MPSGKTAQPEIVDNKDGTVTVKYAPTEAGLHEMHIKYNGTHIPGQNPQPHYPQNTLIGFEWYEGKYIAILISGNCFSSGIQLLPLVEYFVIREICAFVKYFS